MRTMINKKLLREMRNEKRYLYFAVLCKVSGLLCNAFMVFEIARFIEALLSQNYSIGRIAIVLVSVILVQTLLSRINAYLSFRLSADLKKQLRQRLFQKVYSFGSAYAKKASPAEIVQLSVEGIEQLDIYYAKFIPQFLYSMISPLILFIILLRLNFTIALVLFLIVPLIPLTIVMLQKLAKRITKTYWGSFVKLSELFLDMLKGMTTLKVYQADAAKNNELNRISESFRRNTMRVLAVQLNNITLMDIIALGGAAFGTLYSIHYYSTGLLSLAQAIIFILISAEFFLPLRLLGSFFHIAMNGMAASDKLFDLLDTPVDSENGSRVPLPVQDIVLKDVSFQYQDDRTILKNINMHIKANQLTAIVGESGCGKSTIASLITGVIEPVQGSVLINGISKLSSEDRVHLFTRVDHAPYLFAGTVKENLLMANPNASDSMLWNALEQVKLKDFLEKENGLLTPLEEQAQNLSGGQKQRLGIARALLKDSPVYVFDEASSNIDVESEEAILDLIQNLKSQKTIILITHRLKSAQNADLVYVMQEGQLLQSGTFDVLSKTEGRFKTMYDAQHSLENWSVDNA